MYIYMCIYIYVSIYTCMVLPDPTASFSRLTKPPSPWYDG